MVSVAFTGGGTGGHIYPGLAVASLLKKLLPVRIFWIGSNAGMDRAIVETFGFEFFGIPSGKLRRYFSLRNLSDLFKIAAGFFAARKILKREDARLLFSKGGFVSVPPCAAAKLLKIPVFTHESDFSPGLATRINANFAEKIFIPYKESASFYSGSLSEKIFVSGNPIRKEFAAASGKKGRAFLGLSSGERILLVLGGSSGSLEVNKLIKKCLPHLTGYYTVVHQTGEDNIDSAGSPFVNYKPYAYFGEEIPHVIAAAELIICRSGAGTIWECKSLNKPMVLIPFRGSGTRGDQVENARLFEKAGAAICFIPEENEPPDEKLSQVIASLACDGEKRRIMGEAKIVDYAESSSGFSGTADLIAKEIAVRIGGDNGKHTGN
jgi:UDP-N-acetylglucosamine--N-acetylmuramyl-(pentapeptide) pyrophosphoryl-undecaprenol N-acetylglucosamine transferase